MTVIDVSGTLHMMTSSNGNISPLLAICAGNSPVNGEFPAQRPVTRSFDAFFDLHLNKWLSKQSWSWWLETPFRPLWRHCMQTFGYENRVACELHINCAGIFDNQLFVRIIIRSNKNESDNCVEYWILYFDTHQPHDFPKVALFIFDNDKHMGTKIAGHTHAHGCIVLRFVLSMISVFFFLKIHSMHLPTFFTSASMTPGSYISLFHQVLLKIAKSMNYSRPSNSKTTIRESRALTVVEHSGLCYHWFLTGLYADTNGRVKSQSLWLDDCSSA